MALELNYEERLRLGQLVMDILDDWRITDEAQLALLGLPQETPRRQLTRLRHGSAPMPEEPEVIERSRHILGIQQALHLIFALNTNMPGFWLTNPNNRQFGRAPMEIMLDEGLDGMRRVWGHLDCTQNW